MSDYRAIPKDKRELKHQGTPRHSGRYPWGSGDNPYQSEESFLGHVSRLKTSGLTESQIAKGLGMSTSELRAKKSIARASIRAAQAAEAVRLHDKGYSNVAIGKRMGINESSVRGLLDPSLRERFNVANATADMLKRELEKTPYLDVGSGVEVHLGITETKLKTALAVMKESGYDIYNVYVEQAGTGKNTTVKVLAKKGLPIGDIYDHLKDVRMPTQEVSDDGGANWNKIEYPKSVDPKRVSVVYTSDDGESGGVLRDGLIELRRGVPDISLGDAKYAQVRILIGEDRYAKGMAVYADDLPDGVDIRVNSNKTLAQKDSVFKKIKDDPDNPFGASIKDEEALRLVPRYYTDENGVRQQSVLNVVNEEGNWGAWSKTLASQFLSKQPVPLAKKQLEAAYDIRKDEYDEIMSLTNPAVKMTLLESFASDCDAASVHLKAASLPRQASQVLLPFPDIRENQIYAPNYKNGERVILIRYPHGGRFEIPELIVNNTYPDCRRVLGNARDAVGINHSTAAKLSGADFDGDTALVIPNNDRAIQTMPSLERLKNFDPSTAYPGYQGMKVMTSRQKGVEMGKVSNLITDMTIKGATPDELARAVRHSMVVIDAEKHKLNYRQSYIDHNIKELVDKYQDGGGASTLISRAHGDKRGIPYRKEKQPDPETGEKVYEYTGKTYSKPIKNKKGQITGWKQELVTITSTNMAEVKDANELSSGTLIERVYANHANKLKALANEARKSFLSTKAANYSPEAKAAYSQEVASLISKLNTALKNAPYQRQAQILANVIIDSKRDANPDMDPAELKKIKGQALAIARKRLGAHKERINITVNEWAAIQAGAISHSRLMRILQNADLDQVKRYSMPREYKGLSPAKQARAKAMLASGRTQAEVAEILGVSTSTLWESIGGS